MYSGDLRDLTSTWSAARDSAYANGNYDRNANKQKRVVNAVAKFESIKARIDEIKLCSELFVNNDDATFAILMQKRLKELERKLDEAANDTKHSCKDNLTHIKRVENEPELSNMRMYEGVCAVCGATQRSYQLSDELTYMQKADLWGSRYDWK